jgi:hypothetical protein
MYAAVGMEKIKACWSYDVLELFVLSEPIVTKLRLVKGYSFGVEFDLKDMPSIVVDEAKPIGDSLGPNPT